MTTPKSMSTAATLLAGQVNLATVFVERLAELAATTDNLPVAIWAAQALAGSGSLEDSVVERL